MRVFDRSQLLRFAFFQRARPVLALTLMLGMSRLCAALEVPARPADYLADAAGVFPPEATRRLLDSLKSCANEHDVQVYVMTVPTLKVMPSRAEATLEELCASSVEKWTRDQVGAVVSFDDETGLATLRPSDEAERVLSSVALNIVFKDPRVQSGKKRVTPEKLEAITMVLVSELSDLKMKMKREAQRQQTMRAVFLCVLTVALLAGGARLLAGKWKLPTRVSAEPRRDEWESRDAG